MSWFLGQPIWVFGSFLAGPSKRRSRISWVSHHLAADSSPIWALPIPTPVCRTARKPPYQGWFESWFASFWTGGAETALSCENLGDSIAECRDDWIWKLWTAVMAQPIRSSRRPGPQYTSESALHSGTSWARHSRARSNTSRPASRPWATHQATSTTTPPFRADWDTTSACWWGSTADPPRCPQDLRATP